MDDINGDSSEVIEEIIELESEGDKEEPQRIEDSVEESIRQSVEEVRGKDAAQEKDSLQGDKVEESKPAREAKEPPSELEKRDNKGRFQKKEKTSQEKSQDKSGEQRLEAPVRWPVASKEEFNKLPPVAKKEILSFWGGIESHTTKLWQDLNRHKTRYEQIDRLVGHYLPKWNLKGITDVQALGELCATQDAILKSPVEAYSLMLQKSGVTPEMLIEYRKSGRPPTLQRQADPQISELTNRVNELYNGYKTAQTSQYQAQVQSGVSEVEELRRQTDQGGRYLWPELWDVNYLKRVQPLVDQVRETQPGISWADATKKALVGIRAIEGRGSPSLNAPGSRLSRENEIAKARQASVSIRGRGSATVPTSVKAMPGESVEDTLRSVFAERSQTY